jgi:hypothetical protein
VTESSFIHLIRAPAPIETHGPLFAIFPVKHDTCLLTRRCAPYELMRSIQQVKKTSAILGCNSIQLVSFKFKLHHGQRVSVRLSFIPFRAKVQENVEPIFFNFNKRNQLTKRPFCSRHLIRCSLKDQPIGAACRTVTVASTSTSMIHVLSLRHCCYSFVFLHFFFVFKYFLFGHNLDSLSLSLSIAAHSSSLFPPVWPVFHLSRICFFIFYLL